MSYISADEVLPKELVEKIQQYISGKSIYIPCKEKQNWGSQSKAKQYYQKRNREICTKYRQGASVKMLAAEYFLSEKSIQRIIRSTKEVKEYRYITLMEAPTLKDMAAEWFHSKWGVPKEAYLECMEAYLNKETKNGWYLCLDGEKIVAGLGVIENDFHDRKDLSPNVCAVYTEEDYRCRGIAGDLLNMVTDDMKSKGVSPLYLISDHIDFYERYGWEFLCMVQEEGEPKMTKMYIHR